MVQQKFNVLVLHDSPEKNEKITAKRDRKQFYISNSKARSLSRDVFHPFNSPQL
ncbi:hypothetical protein CKA32_005347 [Geitlerinema sp. FC II]|nr:hypothetical protein CKA32_005347 [Geitlerinema sp. FC II]